MNDSDDMFTVVSRADRVGVEQMATGFSTICLEPSKFIDAARDLPVRCADVMRRADATAVQ